jgi:hypothetical protein
MKRFLALSLIGLAAAACTAEPPQPDLAGEARLDTELRGRTAGTPVACVSSRDVRGNRGMGSAIVFEAQGGRVWVNNPPGGCPELREHLALRRHSPSTQLCRGDFVAVFDPRTGMEHGACTLGEFVPYSRRAPGS